jgi:hypothetical protein
MVGYFSWAHEENLRALYTPEFLAEIGETRADQKMVDFLEGIPNEVTVLDRMLALEQRYTWPTLTLCTQTRCQWQQVLRCASLSLTCSLSILLRAYLIDTGYMGRGEMDFEKQWSHICRKM